MTVEEEHPNLIKIVHGILFIAAICNGIACIIVRRRLLLQR